MRLWLICTYDLIRRLTEYLYSDINNGNYNNTNYKIDLGTDVVTMEIKHRNGLMCIGVTVSLILSTAIYLTLLYRGYSWDLTSKTGTVHV